MKCNVNKKHYNKRTDLSRFIGAIASIEGDIDVVDQRGRQVIKSYRKGKRGQGCKYYISDTDVYNVCLKNVKIKIKNKCFYFNHIWIEANVKDVSLLQNNRGVRIKAYTNIVQYFKGYRGNKELFKPRSTTYNISCGVDKLINPQII